MFPSIGRDNSEFPNPVYREIMHIYYVMCYFKSEYHRYVFEIVYNNTLFTKHRVICAQLKLVLVKGSMEDKS